MAASYNRGRVAVFSAGESGYLAHRAWRAHDDAEVWCAIFGDHCVFGEDGAGCPNTLFSGGDDARLRRWDLRVPFGAGPCFSARFPAGVTCLHAVPGSESLLTAGDYADRVTLWDLRAPRGALAEADVGGGVWRLKYRPGDASVVLCAAMRGGFRARGVDGEGGRLEQVAEMLAPHGEEALCYGADWVGDGEGEEGVLGTVGCCSFYDDLFTLSVIEKKM